MPAAGRVGAERALPAREPRILFALSDPRRAPLPFPPWTYTPAPSRIIPDVRSEMHLNSTELGVDG